MMATARHRIDRRWFCAGAVAAVAGLATPVLGAAGKPPVVLFVCQFGTAKSAIARELFRRRAAERGIAVTAFSRGITPEPHLSAQTRALLAAEGIDPDRDKLAPLQRADLDVADTVVIFNPLPAALDSPRAQDWSALPSVNDAYPLARAELDRRIDALLDRIEQK